MFRRLLHRIDAATWVVIVLAAISGMVWAVRLEARDDVQDVAIAAVKDEQAVTNAHVLEELRYMRARVDEIANGLK